MVPMHTTLPSAPVLALELLLVVVVVIVLIVAVLVIVVTAATRQLVPRASLPVLEMGLLLTSVGRI